MPPSKTLAMVQTAVRRLEPRDLPIPETEISDDATLDVENEDTKRRVRESTDGRDAELAIRTRAREIEGEEAIHSCLIPERD
jgi:hypothetical protein